MREKPGIAAALRFLAALVERMRRDRQSRLPPIKTVARQAGVGHTTMSEAVAQLRHDGVLQVRPRRGIHIAGLAAQSEPTAPPFGDNYKRHRLKMRLSQDLANGVFGSDSLPSPKELCVRYGVSRMTLAKSIRALAEEGMLVSAGRAFRPAVPRSDSERNTIVLFLRSDESDEPIMLTPRGASQFSALEHLCRTRNVQLRVASCKYQDDDRLRVDGRDVRSLPRTFSAERTLGFMVWQISLSAQTVSELVGMLLRLGRPIALFHEEPSGRDFAGMPVVENLRRYSIAADFDAGVAVGRYLLSRGHRRVCCWSDRAGLEWVEERLRGIRRAFADAGFAPEGVVHRAALGSEGVGRIGLGSPIQGELGQAAEKVLRRWRIVPRRERTQRASSDLFWNYAYLEHMYRRSLSAMEKQLHSGGATVWVGMNDRRAMECLWFLRSRHAKVPQEIAVIGFDDSLDAGLSRLTSYNFGGDAAMNRMVDFLLRPNAPTARSERGVMVTVKGFVHERGTA